MIKAVLFDVDGTLLDTSEYIYQAFEHSLKSVLGIKLDRSKIREVLGKPLVQCYEKLVPSQSISELSFAHKEFQNKNSHLAFAFPNAKETLSKLHQKGLLIAVITSRARESATVTLEQAGLMKYIDLFIGIEDVVAPKPDPEGINKALAQFGILAQEAVMVGDSDVDIMAGKSAGTGTIGVSYGFHGEKIGTHNPDKVIKSLLEILTELNI